MMSVMSILLAGVWVLALTVSIGSAQASTDIYFNGQKGFSVDPTQGADSSYSFGVTMYNIDWQAALAGYVSPPPGSDWAEWFGFWIGKGQQDPPIDTADGTAQNTAAPVWKGSNGKIKWGVPAGHEERAIVDDGPSPSGFPALKTFVVTPDPGHTIPAVQDWSPEDFSFHLQWQDQAGRGYTDWVQGDHAPELPVSALLAAPAVFFPILRRLRRG